jgi:L-fucono-1,5-lactonase
VPTADAHVHFFADGGYCGVRGSSPAGGDETAVYERLRRYHGIERSLVLGYEGEPHYLGNSEHILGLARTRPWMAPLAYLPTLPAPTLATLRKLSGGGAVGFALYPTTPGEGRAFSDWPSAVFAEMRRQRALVSVNAAPDTAAEMARIGADLDGCTVLFSHLGSPGRCSRPPGLSAAREELKPLLALSAWSNIGVKFSGLYAISDPGHDFPHDAARPFVDIVLDAFGPSRLLWGSDFSPALDFVSFAQLADARLLSGCSQAEIDAVMGGNLLRLLEGRS